MADNTRIREGVFQLPELSMLPPDGGEEFNRLVFTSSPYLLQHARNPVDWYPWCDEAFERARAEDKAIFLSIGYSTCHWCHVMEHESFEDAEVAAYLNEHFISIKVDREERPDIDHIYMAVCQAMNGSGGWPLSVFLTPDALPFFAGTYFPKVDRHGRPGFLRLLSALREAWLQERERVFTIGEELRSALQQAAVKSSGDISGAILDTAVQEFMRLHDAVYGGFGSAPKFPMGHNVSFLLGRAVITADADILPIVESSLLRMYRGGLWDHVGGGFCRYSTDKQWLVPHFEKMLYDNALLLSAYADAFRVTRTVQYKTIAREIVSYISRELRDANGMFYSAENADSEGVEGRFYVFSQSEFGEIVDAHHRAILEEYFGITDRGNFENGMNILHIAVDPAEWRQRHTLGDDEAERIIADAKAALFAARARRVHPSLDDKILTSWNGLCIAALARAGMACGDAEMISMSRRAADVLLSRMQTKEGRLLHRLRGDNAGIHGFLEDYAFLIQGLLELYEACFEITYLERAIALADTMLDLFGDEATGALRFIPRDGERLITDVYDVHDGAIPSGNGMASLVLARLGRMTGRMEYEEAAWNILRSSSSSITSYPTGSTVFLMALEFLQDGGTEVVLSGDDVSEMAKSLRRHLLPRTVALHRPASDEAARIEALAPFTRDLLPRDGLVTAYVCRNYACEAPVHSNSELEALLLGIV